MNDVMDHVAILSKKNKLLNKILNGEKTIESRWYKFRKTPFGNIAEGDNIYFKESGDLVSASAKVGNALFFDNLDEKKVKEIFDKYKKELGVDDSYLPNIVEKKFCTLVYLEDVKKIEPFEINKKGFGMMAAWISVENIDSIKLP